MKFDEKVRGGSLALERIERQLYAAFKLGHQPTAGNHPGKEKFERGCDILIIAVISF